MASYATAIKEAMDIEPTIEEGARGQFDVVVNGATVVSRKGGLMALLFRKPWPDHDEVVGAIQAKS